MNIIGIILINKNPGRSRAHWFFSIKGLIVSLFKKPSNFYINIRISEFVRPWLHGSVHNLTDHFIKPVTTKKHIRFDVIRGLSVSTKHSVVPRAAPLRLLELPRLTPRSLPRPESLWTFWNSRLDPRHSRTSLGKATLMACHPQIVASKTRQLSTP